MKYEEIRNYAQKIDIKKLQNQNFKITSTVKKSVESYNSAVSNIQVGNIDIAIIKLRKVVTLRPDFGEAVNLLNLLVKYEQSNNKEKTVEKHVQKKSKTQESVLHPIINTKKKTLPEILNISPRTLMKVIVFFTFIIVIISIILIVSTIVNHSGKTDSEQINNNISSLNSTINLQKETITTLTKELDDKSKTLNENTEKIVVLEEQLKNERNLLNLYLAKSYYSDGRYADAAEILLGLKEVQFKDEDLDVYNQVYQGAMTESAKSVYNIGINLFNQQNYQGALENLLMVQEYDSSFEEMAQTLYYIGKTYYELGLAEKAIDSYKQLELNYPEFPDKDYILYNAGKAYMKLENDDKALEMFNLILSDYPSSSLIGYTKDKIKEIKNK